MSNREPRMYDTFSTVALNVWDLKKRFSAYSGPAVRAIRASDAVEQDFGFGADGWFDFTAYSAFGTGSEKLVTVYDQSGNAQHFTQSDNALRPIVRLSSYNGKPCFYFNQRRMRVTGFTAWDGLADLHVFMPMRMIQLSTGFPFISGSGHRQVYWTGAPTTSLANNVYVGVDVASLNRYTRHLVTGQLNHFQFDGGAGTDALKVRMFSNQTELTAGVTATQPTVTPNDTHLDWGGTPLDGSAHEWECWGFHGVGQDLSAPQIAAIKSELIADLFTFTSSNLLCEGDSLTYGTGLVAPPTDAGTYPNQLKALLEADTGTTWNTTNSGTPGTGITGIEAGIHADVLHQRDEWAVTDILVLWYGTNDLAGDVTGGSTIVDAILASIVSMATLAEAKGFSVNVPNMLPRTDVDNVNPTFETDRASFNSQLPTELSGLNATVIDVAGRAELDDPSDGTYFYGDEVHLVAAGYGAVADEIFTDIS